jgi:hypothetical protein
MTTLSNEAIEQLKKNPIRRNDVNIENQLNRLYDKLEYHQNKINYLNLEIAKLEILKNEEKAK